MRGSTLLGIMRGETPKGQPPALREGEGQRRAGSRTEPHRAQVAGFWPRASCTQRC